MAARTHKVTLNQEWREKIRTARLIQRLECFALDEKDPVTKRKVKMTPQQVRAVEVLLKKNLPDLQAISLEGGGDDAPPMRFKIVKSR